MSKLSNPFVAVIGKLRSLARHPRPIRLLASRVLWHTGLCESFITSADGFRLRFFPSAMSAAYWVNPRERERDESVIRALLHPGDYCVDVGANIGALSLVAAKCVGDRGTVLAIEPHPRVFTFLVGNLELNGIKNVKAINVAVGERSNRTLTFSDRHSDDQNAVDAEGVLHLPCSTLDELVPSDVEHVRLIKLDVEGYELFVCRGAERVLGLTDAVYFESWDHLYGRFAYTSREMFEFLRRAGFEIFRVAPQSRSLQLISRGHVSRECENLLALRHSDLYPSRGHRGITSSQI